MQIPYALVINEGASSAQRFLPQLKETSLYKNAPEQYRKIVPPQEVITVLEDFAQQGIKHVIIGGGDGTLHSALNMFAGSNVTLGILPLGTANDIALGLGIPLDDIVAAAEVSLHGKKTPISAGVMNGTYFLNAAAIGFPAEVTESEPTLLKQVLGKSAYALKGIAAAASYQSFECTITVGDFVATFTARHVAVINGGSHAGREVNDIVSVAEHQLAALVLGSDGTLAGYAAQLAQFLAYKNIEDTDIPVLIAQDFLLTTSSPQAVQLDGESYSEQRFHFTCEENILQVCVPEE